MITLSCPREYLCMHVPGKQVKLEVIYNVEQIYVNRFIFSSVIQHVDDECYSLFQGWLLGYSCLNC